MAAILYNGLGRYTAAQAATEPTQPRPPLCLHVGAARADRGRRVRGGDTRTARDALERLAETTPASGADYGLGLEARSRALLSDGEAADGLYRQAIDRLSRTRLGPELARAHLLYGEWLRREAHRADARTQLRTAYQMLATMGAAAFAERARRELLAVGETARKRAAKTRTELTAQEASIARLARTATPTRRSAPSCFSAPARSNGTWATCSPSSESARAVSYAGRCRTSDERICRLVASDLVITPAYPRSSMLDRDLRAAVAHNDPAAGKASCKARAYRPPCRARTQISTFCAPSRQLLRTLQQCRTADIARRTREGL